MTAALAIVLSGILYRIPRGGPDGSWWDDAIGVHEVHGARVWAIGSGLLLAGAAGLWWAAPAVALLLWLGEKPGYMHNITPQGVRVLPMTLRGLLLLNPLMGLIYWSCHSWRGRLPVYGVVMDGWTAWAELACGLTVAAAWFAALSVAASCI